MTDDSGVVTIIQLLCKCGRNRVFRWTHFFLRINLLPSPLSLPGTKTCHAQLPGCRHRHFRIASRRGERAIQRPKSSNPRPAAAASDGDRMAWGCRMAWRTSASSWFNTLALVILPHKELRKARIC